MGKHVRLIMIVGVFVLIGVLLWRTLGSGPEEVSHNAAPKLERVPQEVEASADSSKRAKTVRLDKGAVGKLTQSQKKQADETGPGWIKVTVTLDDKPVEGATVTITRKDWDDYSVAIKETFTKTALSDAEGKCTFVELPLAEYYVTAVLDDAYAEQKASLNNDRSYGIALLKLVPVGSISGHVRNTEGEPIPGAVLFRMSEDNSKAYKWAAAVTDEMGAFTALHVPEGSRRFFVRAEGYANKITLPDQQRAVVARLDQR